MSRAERQSAPCGQVAQRVGVQEVQRGQLAGRGAARDLRRGPALERRVGEPRARVGQHADLGQAAAVRARRDAQQPGALARACELEAARDVEQRAGGVVGAGAGEQALAVEDHDVLARVGEQVGERVDGAGLGARRLGEAADLVPARLARRRRRARRRGRRAAPRRRPGRSGCAAWRSRPATTAGSSRRRASPRGGARPCGCAGRRSACRRPARSRGRARRGRTRGRGPSPGRPGRRARAAAPATARRPRASRCRATRGPRGRCAGGGSPPRSSSRRRRPRRRGRWRACSPDAASLSARSHETGRSSPPSRTIGAGDALVDVDGLVGEAALVAQPAVVHARRCRGRARAGRARRGP